MLGETQYCQDCRFVKDYDPRWLSLVQCTRYPQSPSYRTQWVSLTHPDHPSYCTDIRTGPTCEGYERRLGWWERFVNWLIRPWYW